MQPSHTTGITSNNNPSVSTGSTNTPLVGQTTGTHTTGVPGQLGTNITSAQPIGTTNFANQPLIGQPTGPYTTVPTLSNQAGSLHHGTVLGTEVLGTGVIPVGTTHTQPMGTTVIQNVGAPVTTTQTTTHTEVLGQQHGLVSAPIHNTGIIPTQPTGIIEPGNTLGLRDQPNVLPAHTLPGNTTAQGQFIFRPLEGRFINDKDPMGKMDPYVKIKLGWHSGKSAVAKSEGQNPTWNDAIALPRKHNETFAKIKVKDKDRATLNDRIGDVKVNLDEIVSRGRVTQWYTVTKKDKSAGEILLDIEYSPIFMK